MFHLRRVELSGHPLPGAQEALRLKSGDPAIAADVLAAQGRMLEALRNQGYALAKVQTPVATLAPELASTIAAGEIASVTLRAHELIAVDDFAAMPATGRFVLRHAFVTVGGGILHASGSPDHRGTPERSRNPTPPPPPAHDT